MFLQKSPLERGKHELFLVHHIKESIVAFESALFPGFFVCISGPSRAAFLDPIDHHNIMTELRAHFVVHVKVRPKQDHFYVIYCLGFSKICAEF